MARQQRFDWWISAQPRDRSRSQRPRRTPTFEPLEVRRMLSLNAGYEEPGHEHDASSPHVMWAPPIEGAPLPILDEFNASGGRWSDDDLSDGVTITYSYSNFLDGGLPGGLSAEDLIAATEEALNLWAANAPLNFVEIADSGPAPSDSFYEAANHPDIRIGHHFIDGRFNVLAHAYFPLEGAGRAGDVHFDSGDTWSLNPGSGFDVIEVMTHELGHSLGLGHEPPTGEEAIMNPFYGGRFSGLGTGFLFEDDIAGIQELYGEGVGSVTPLQPLVVDIVEDQDNGNIEEGDVSLREAIAASLAGGGLQAVTFAESLAGQTLMLDSPLIVDGSLEIEGLGSSLITIQANDPSATAGDGFRLFEISNGDPNNADEIFISGVTLRGGDSAADGGAIFTDELLTLDDVVIEQNRSGGMGGAIYSTAMLTINSSTIDDNSADGDGGGVHSEGGVVIDSSTVSNNSSGDEGGGISVAGEGTDIVITSSTISGNTAEGDGGGLHSLDVNPRRFRLFHSTVFQNVSGGSGGGIYEYDGVLFLDHTIIAGNTAASEAADIDSINFLNTPVVIAKNSLIGSDGGANINSFGGNQIGSAGNPINPMLLPLADNGGPTMTNLPGPGSPAVNAGDPEFSGPPEFDQRGEGFRRVDAGDGRIDIGAVESAGFALDLIVDTLADESDGDFSTGDLSLREAIEQANAADGDDRITFADTLPDGLIELNPVLGELAVTGSVIIDASTHSITIDAAAGQPQPLVDGAGVRLFRLDDGDSENQINVEIVGLTLTGGNVDGDGGAIHSVENLTLRNVSLLANGATNDGGGLYHSTGSLTLEQTTIANNEAGSDGGGLYTNTELEDSTGHFVHVTVSGNTAADDGGGLFNFDGLLTIEHSTFTDNTAAYGGGIVSFGDPFTKTSLASSIVAGNQGLDVSISAGLAFNSFSSAGYNLVGIGNGFLAFNNNDLAEVLDPKLGPLQDNGGTTLTHMPEAGSPVVDAGDPIFTVRTYAEEVAANSPALYWKLDDDTGSTSVADAAGSVDGTVVGEVALGSFGAGAETGTAAALDGVDDHIDSSGPLATSGFGDQYSAAIWFNAGNVDALQTVFDWYEGDAPAAASKAGVQLEEGGQITFFGNDVATTTTSVAEAGSWHLVVIVRDGDQARIYLDGVLENAETVASEGISADTSVALGRNAATEADYFGGSLDEFIVYASSLTDQDVARLYHNAITPEADRLFTDQRGDGFSRVVDGDDDATPTIDIGAVETPVPETDPDFNSDGRVNGFDLLAWQRGFGTDSGATKSDGDANGDGAVDADDLEAWEEKLGDFGPVTIVTPATPGGPSLPAADASPAAAATFDSTAASQILNAAARGELFSNLAEADRGAEIMAIQAEDLSTGLFAAADEGPLTSSEEESADIAAGRREATDRMLGMLADFRLPGAWL